MYSWKETHRCDSRGRRSRPSHEKLTIPLVQSSSQTLALYCNTKRRHKAFPENLRLALVSWHPGPVRTGPKMTGMKERSVQILQKAVSITALLTLVLVNSLHCPQDIHLYPHLQNH